MILSGDGIKQARVRGDLVISPWNEAQLNSNSYNLRLHDKLEVYKTEGKPFVLDCYEKHETIVIPIPAEGFVLMPSTLYLGSPLEWTETRAYVPILDGRSSLARLGVSVHISAGFGDVGFRGVWTLEITAVLPVRIYAGMQICQIYYEEVSDGVSRYAGKYQDSTKVVASKLYEEKPA